MKRTNLIAALGISLCAMAFTLPTHAQQAALQTKVIILGTQGGPLPVGKRAQPANAVVVGDRIYLVDAGNGVIHQLALAGLDFRRVDNVFITHNHDDHNADWGTLIGLQVNTGKVTPTNVYGPYGTEDMRLGAIQYLEANARVRRGDVRSETTPANVARAHDIKPGLVFQDDHVKVTAAEVCHYHFDAASEAAKGARDKSFAFRFETPDKVIVFSGDTGPCPVLVDFAKDADILVHEVISLPMMADMLRQVMASQPPSGVAPDPSLMKSVMRHMQEDHTSPEDIGKLATAAHVKKVVLTHFVPGRDSDPDGAYVDGVKKFFDGPVVAARDLMQF